MLELSGVGRVIRLHRVRIASRKEIDPDLMGSVLRYKCSSFGVSAIQFDRFPSELIVVAPVDDVVLNALVDEGAFGGSGSHLEHGAGGVRKMP